MVEGYWIDTSDGSAETTCLDGSVHTGKGIERLHVPIPCFIFQVCNAIPSNLIAKFGKMVCLKPFC